ncbi:MAG: hypothetical protein LBC69_02605, partial [Eubacteriaceae bacterium]|nr:hypothetical protein [Eubacteriaceae bacterium]
MHWLVLTRHKSGSLINVEKHFCQCELGHAPLVFGAPIYKNRLLCRASGFFCFNSKQPKKPPSGSLLLLPVPHVKDHFSMAAVI